MALSKHHITVELREILLKDRPKELLKISPKGTVPVLQNNNNVLDESLDIINWVIDNSDSDWKEINQDLQKDMIQINDNEFKHWLDRYKYSDRYPEQSKKYYRDKCKKYLDDYESKLKDKVFLMGNKIQMVDVAIFPFIRQFAFTDKDIFSKSFPRVFNYLEFFLESDLFVSVMNKYPVWAKDNGIITDFSI